MTYDGKKKFIVNILYIISLVGILYFAVRYLLSWFMPFIVGFIIAYILKPAADFIEDFTKIKNKGVSIFVISCFYIGIIGILGFFIVNIWGLIYDFLRQFPYIFDKNIEPIIISVNDWIVSFINTLSPSIADLLADSFNEILSVVTQIVSGMSKVVLSTVTRFAQRIPVYFITLLFSIICSVLITIDYKNVSRFILRQIPERAQEIMFDIKKIFINTIVKMTKAYLILLFIAFIEMCIGFIMLGIDNAIAIAAIVAILDLVPLIGIGGILVPWGVYELIAGSSITGIGLIIIYIISYILRNTLEPKIVGKQIGLPSLVMFVSMFAGFKIFGFVGFVIAPIIAIIIKQLNDNNKIKLYK